MTPLETTRVMLLFNVSSMRLNPNRPLDCYAQTYFGINPTISRHGIAQARLALLIWLNEMVLFSSVFPFIGCDKSPLRPLSIKASVQKT